MKIWQKYLLRKLFGTFTFLLICIFSVYILVDFSIYGVRFLSSSATSWTQVVLYYLHHFAMHMELFFPLTWLLTSMKTLLDLTAHQELIALQMAGLSKKKLLAPFFLFAFFLSAVCYVNAEWWMPEAQNAALSFKKAHSKNQKERKESLYTIPLKDGSELIYQRFDAQENKLFDVFWVRKAEDIWHMKYLQIDSTPPEGRFADHLLRNSCSQLEKAESFDRKKFAEISWNEETVFQKFIPFDQRSLSQLFQQSFISSADHKKMRAYLHYKLALPLLSLLILVAISSVSMRSSRNRKTFLIFACGLFAFVALKTALDGMLILAENQVLPATIAIWSPLFFTLGISLPSFAKL